MSGDPSARGQVGCAFASKVAPHISSVNHERYSVQNDDAADPEPKRTIKSKTAVPHPEPPQEGHPLRRGRKEIHGFYDDVNLRGAIPISLIDSGAECIMELANLTTAGDDIWRLSAIDHFTVAPDGQIARLVIYVQRSIASAAGSGTPSATQR